MKQEFAVLGFVAAVVAFAYYWTAVPSTGGELSTIEQDIAVLASDSLEGRATGTEGERKAAAYVASRFESLGLEPKGANGFFQEYTFNPHPTLAIHGQGDSTSLGMSTVQPITGVNVCGFLNADKPLTVIVGAHHDHLGWGDENSLFRGDSAVHNGADDNASGVSALLALAKRLNDRKASLAYNYLFLTFSGEEKGLWGSKKWIEQATVPLSEVNFMFNMDMVGRLNAEQVLAVYGSGTSPAWGMVDQVQTELTFTFHESGVGPSDHTSFYLEGLPVLHFFTGQHEDYHKPSDDADKINYPGIVQVVDLMDSLLLRLNHGERIAFTKTKDEDNASTPSFKVTLGVMPDYMNTETGMRIDGVTEGRPAANAGLQRGDVVVQMGEHEVDGMEAYMKCLSIFEPGETTPVTVLRDGERMTVDVTWK